MEVKLKQYLFKLYSVLQTGEDDVFPQRTFMRTYLEVTGKCSRQAALILATHYVHQFWGNTYQLKYTESVPRDEEMRPDEVILRPHKIVSLNYEDWLNRFDKGLTLLLDHPNTKIKLKNVCLPQ